MGTCPTGYPGTYHEYLPCGVPGYEYLTEGVPEYLPERVPGYLPAGTFSRGYPCVYHGYLHEEVPEYLP